MIGLMKKLYCPCHLLGFLSRYHSAPFLILTNSVRPSPQFLNGLHHSAVFLVITILVRVIASVIMFFGALFTITTTIIIYVSNGQNYSISHWTRGKDPPRSFGGAAAAYSATNNTIWLIGDASGNVNQNTGGSLMSFDIASNNYTDHGNSSFSKRILGFSQFLTQINEYLYMIDSENANRIIRFNIITAGVDYNYDNILIPIRPPLDSLGPSMSAFDGTCLTSYNEYLIVMGGGATYDFCCFADVQIYSLTDHAWLSDVAPMVEERGYFACITHGDRVYAFGGYTVNTFGGTDISRTAEFSDYTGLSAATVSNKWWTHLTGVFDVDLYYARAVSMGSNILVLGKEAQKIYIIDTVENTIVNGVDLGIDLYCSTFVKTDAKLYLLGGGSSSWCGTTIKRAYYMDLPTESPTKQPTVFTLSPTTFAPTAPTRMPSTTPTTANPSAAPTMMPTQPTAAPIANPTTETGQPTKVPTLQTSDPTVATSDPTIATNDPTVETSAPTTATANPTIETDQPTKYPTTATHDPTTATENPTTDTANPTETANPTVETGAPTAGTNHPTQDSFSPTSYPSSFPTFSTDTAHSTDAISLSKEQDNIASDVTIITGILLGVAAIAIAVLVIVHRVRKAKNERAEGDIDMIEDIEKADVNESWKEKNVATWDANDVYNWICSLDSEFEEMAAVLRLNHIRGRALGVISQEQMNELGIALGDRLELENAIKKLFAQGESDPDIEEEAPRNDQEHGMTKSIITLRQEQPVGDTKDDAEGKMVLVTDPETTEGAVADTGAHDDV
eukprot:1159321_1